MVGDRLDALHMATDIVLSECRPRGGGQDDRCLVESKSTEPVIEEARRDDL